MLFKNEITTMDELIDYILNGTEFNTFKVSVVCLLFDTDGSLVLHRRGPGARDEVGKLLAIGGSYNSNDGSFRDSLLRELKEEAGTEAEYEIGDFVGCIADSKVDNTNGELTNWAILAYKGYVKSGKIHNNEPDRCYDFEKFTIEEALANPDLGVSARAFVEALK